MTTPVASVVVCTRDRAALLAGCLRSLREDGSSTPRELIVVDNGSTDDTCAVVEAALKDAPFDVRYVLETRVGQSHARNAGVANANGTLLLFTDDDVVVDDGWVDALVKPFADGSVGAVAGRILPIWPSEPPPWLDGPHATLLTLVDYGAEPRLLEADPPLGANMAVRTEIARRFSPPFDPSLGHRDGLRLAHEEVHFMNRVRTTHTIVYAPEAIVRHVIEPERMRLDYLRRAFFQLGLGLGRRERIERAERPDLARRVVRALRLWRDARLLTRRNDRGARTGASTWSELRAYMFAGRHLEILLGRAPRLTAFIGRRVG